MNIRFAAPNELSTLADMTRQLFEDEPSNKTLTPAQFEDRLRDYLAAGCRAFVFIEDTVVGYALVNVNRTPGYLIDFFICRGRRRGGSGTTAFNLLLRELNTEALDLDVFCWNSRARKFWESLGFEEMAIIMRRTPPSK